MFRLNLALICLVACVLFALACAKFRSPEVSGETHFLRGCASDDECGDEYSCLCGVCSTSCKNDNACSELLPTTCALNDKTAFTQQCGSAPPSIAGICLADCQDQDCAAGERCIGGACVSTRVTTTYPNPTGSCVAADDGSRWGYNSVGSDVWMPDCASQLSREYYRVYATSRDSAYMIPRPDGSPFLDSICADPNHELYALAQRYTLCGNVDVNKVNAMSIGDALKLEHFLHDKLVFVEGADITPYALPSDVLELCQMDSSLRTGPTQAECDTLLMAFSADGSIAFEGMRTTAEMEVLVPKLNTLYGIAGDDLCARLETRARESLDKVIADSDHSCTTDADCEIDGRNSRCHDSCEAVTSTAAAASINVARETISSSICTTFDNAGCPTPISPSCVASIATCRNNVCVEM